MKLLEPEQTARACGVHVLGAGGMLAGELVRLLETR